MIDHGSYIKHKPDAPHLNPERPRIIRNATAPIHRPRPSWIEGYCVYHAPKRLWVDSDFVKIDDGKRYLMTDVTETLQTGNTAPLINNKLSA